jgi:hypothetical protein
LEFRGHQQQGQCLRAVGGALDLQAAAVAQPRPERAAGKGPGIGLPPETIADARGPFEALPQRIGAQPLFGAVGPAGGRRRGLHALAHQAGAAIAAARQHGIAHAQHARTGDDQLLRCLELAGLRRPCFG